MRLVRASFALLAFFLISVVAQDPCTGTATLSFSVDGDGSVDLRLETQKYTDAYDLWTLDFESHRDDTLAIINRDLFPDTFGSCSTVGKILSTPTAFAPTFDPVTSGGGTFIQTFIKGTTGTPRVDTFVFAGSLATLLECKSSRDAAVFTAETFAEEAAITGTVYATCFGSNDPTNASAPITRTEFAFPVRVEASRSVVARVNPTASNVMGEINNVDAKPSLFVNSPAVLDRVGLTLFDIELTLNVTSPSGKAFTLYNPVVSPTFVNTGRVTTWSMFAVRNFPGENPGLCVTSSPGSPCTQELFYRIAMRATDPLNDVKATLEGQFTFDFKQRICSSPDPGSGVCNDTGVTSSLVLNVVAELKVIGGLANEAFSVDVARTALFDVVDGNDVTTRNVFAGERFGLKVQVTPASKRRDYTVKLKELLLCIRPASSEDCPRGLNSNSRVLYDDADPGSVTTKFFYDDQVFEVDFTMIGLSVDPGPYSLTAFFFLNRTSDGVSRTVSHSELLTFQGCPPSSSVFDSSDGSCDQCKAGYKLENFRCISTTTPPPLNPGGSTPTSPYISTVTPSRGVFIGYQVFATVLCFAAAVLL